MLEDQKHHRNVNRGDVGILIKMLLRSAWYRGQKNLQLINKIPRFCNVSALLREYQEDKILQRTGMEI